MTFVMSHTKSSYAFSMPAIVAHGAWVTLVTLSVKSPKASAFKERDLLEMLLLEMLLEVGGMCDGLCY